MIDVLVLNYNDPQSTIFFVKSVENFSIVRKILIVDNCSTDDSYEKISAMSNKKIIVKKTDKNGGYGYGNNWGIRYLFKEYNSEYILLCNPDVVIVEDVICKMESFLHDNVDYSIVSPFMCNANGERETKTAFKIPSKWEYIFSISIFWGKFIHSFNYASSDFNKSFFMDVGAVAGSLFLLRTEDMLKFGMFDENIFLYCEEVVLGKKLEGKGRKTALLTTSTYIHNHSVSINKSYSSFLKRKFLLNESKLFVLKKYYKINLLEKFIAFFLEMLNFVEIPLINIYINFLKKG